MLSSVTWSAFLTTTAIVLLSYYLAVVSIYFRKEIVQLFSFGNENTQGFDFSNEMDGRAMPGNAIVAVTGKDDPYLNGKVHELLEDLKNLLQTAVLAKTIKEELFMALQLLLRNYSMLKGLPITTEINDHIITEVKRICSIALSDADMNMLWNG